MEVNINNLRINLVKQYDFLIHTLNKNKDEYGEIRIDSDYIRELVNDIKVKINILSCSFIENNDEMQDVSLLSENKHSEEFL